MPTEAVAWSLASDTCVEFTHEPPEDSARPLLSEWTLEELVKLLNVSALPVPSPDEATLAAQFAERCRIRLGHVPEGEAYTLAFECFKEGILVNNHALVYAEQRQNILQAALAKRLTPELWEQVEKTCWSIFKDGASNYRGCTKERLEELYDLLKTGSQPTE